MKLYSFSITPNNRKVEAFIRHYDLDVEIHAMNFKDKENQTEAYRKINPLGKAPALVDGDFCLWESNAILTYIAAMFPQANAMPTDPRGRADVDRWLHWQSFHFTHAILAHKDDAEKAAREFRPHLDMLNAQLEGRDFVRGDLGVVDFAIVPYAIARLGRNVDYSGHPNIVAWLERVEKLKGFVETQFRPPSGATA
ncbi:MAG: glutathione S-transferase family protein [Gammaproteobacteria bacterium]|nr:glutathione S-transferase family protein [Gammaproteobacteria bacterium]